MPQPSSQLVRTRQPLVRIAPDQVAGSPFGDASAASLIARYLFDEEFVAPAAAPLTSPRGALPGPGVLVFTDASNKLSIVSERLQWATVTTNNSDPRGVSSVTIPRAIGRAFHASFNSTKVFYGLDTVNTQCPQHTGIFLSGNSLILTVNSLQPNLGDLVAQASYYNWIIVLQSDGCYYFVKAPSGADYPYWTLLWFSTANASANLYFGIGAANGTPSQTVNVDCLRAADLQGGFQTDYGIATSYAATAIANATGVMSANGMVVCSRAFATNDVFELSVRYVDDNNRIVVRCDQAGSTVKVIKIAAGVETELSTAAMTWTNGTTYRVGVRLLDYSIKPVINDVVKTGTVAAVFQAAATGMKVSHAVTKWAAFPRIVTGSPALWLSALAGAQAGSVPTAGTQDFPAEGYMDRVLALSPNAYWPMQEQYGTTLLDATGNARSGTNSSPADTIPNGNGHYGTAYRLDASDTAYLQPSVAFTAAFNPNEFSVSCWVYFDFTNSLTDPKIIEAWNPAGTQYFALECVPPTTGAPNTMLEILLREAEGDQQIPTGLIVPDKTWHHLVYYNSLSAGKTGLYFDGVLHEYAKTSVLGITGGGSGVGYPFFCGRWAGAIQHLAIFTGKMSQANVNTICT